MESERAATRVDILGVHVNAIDRTAALDQISRWTSENERQYVCVTGVHGVMECQDDAELRRIHNESGLTVPDGMPMVWLGRLAGAKWMERVCGPDLMLQLCEASAKNGWTHFFYGGAPGVAEKLAERLCEAYPGLRVGGTYTPPFRDLEESEKDEISSLINEAEPDLVWVGLSTPKQERWMDEFRGRLAAPALLGVGAAFDLHAGLTTRAPRWMQRSGLEWLYRLLTEPRRLWRRYLTNNPRFIWKAMRRPPVLVPERPIENSNGTRGRFVVIVGPDGAGKTTIASHLLKQLPGRYFHFRPPLRRGNLHHLPPSETAPKKEQGPSPAVVGWIRLFRNVLWCWVGYFTAIRPTLRTGDIVVADRWMYGYLVQPGPLRYSGPLWLARLAIAALPTPDLVVNVAAPAETIRSRKDELDLPTIRSELQMWSQLPAPNTITVSNTEKPCDVVTRLVDHLAIFDTRRK